MDKLSILYIGRQSSTKVDHIKENLHLHFNMPQAEIIYYQTPLQVFLNKIGFPAKYKHLPKPLRLLLKGALLLRFPKYWKYLPKAKRKELDTLELLQGNLVETVKALDKPNLWLFTTSRGARIASLVADRLNVKGIICFGYPFKHPENGVEPERYAHLAFLKTPMLIIQGENDVYGGAEITSKYKYSTAIKVSIVSADHNFDVSQQQMAALFNEAKVFMEKTGT